MGIKLFMILLGCRPEGRATEQHDIFFGIGACVKELIPAMKAYWPEAKGRMHVDAWQEIKYANGYEVRIAERSAGSMAGNDEVKLFFINLGGYKQGEFEEYHYKMVVAGPDKAAAVKRAKATAWFKHTGYKGGEAHIDDKYGIDVDDLYAIEDILHNDLKEQYSITLLPCDAALVNEQHVGYFRLDKL